jgi:hypothetical protein
MGRPTVIVVGADKGGVGKTTVSRTLLDYLAAKGLEVEAFDTQVPNGVLRRFHGSKTTLVDLTTLEGKMKVFDNLKPTGITVVDLAAGLLTPTIETLRETGFIQMVKDGAADFVVLHVVGSSVASLEEVKTVREAVEGMRLFVVSNPIGAAPADRSAFGDAIVIDMPKLDEGCFKAIDQSNMPFTEFCAKTTSLMMKGYTVTWLAKMFKALEVCRFGA